MDMHVELFRNTFMNYMCSYLYKFIRFKKLVYKSGLDIVRMDCWDRSITSKLEERDLRIYETYANAYEQFVNNKENIFNRFQRLRCNAVKRETFLDDIEDWVYF